MLKWLHNLILGADESYKAARVNRTNHNWQPKTHAGEDAIREAWELMSARSRDLAINSPTAKAIAGTLADLIVGAGLQSYAVPFSTDVLSMLDTPDLLRTKILRDLEYSLESDEFFERWSKTADADSENSWGELERLAMYELINAGNAILLEVLQPSADREIPLCYQLIERDQLDATQDRPGAPGMNRIQNGIEYDARNRKVAYHIYDAHPASNYDYRGLALSSRIPASRIIHAYMRFRPSQRSGHPWAQEAHQSIRDGDWYMGAELTSAALGALLTFIHRSPNHDLLHGLSDGMDDDSDEHGNPLMKLGAGLIFKGGVDDNIEIAESKRPNRDAAPFIAEIRTEQAMGAGISPSRLTRDYRNHSYTSARAAHLDDDAHIKPLQRFFASKISLPVRRKVNAMAAGMGLFKSKTPREFRRDMVRLQQFEALGPGREQLDPEKETEAAISKLRAGLSNLQIENGRRQQHWVRVLLQRVIEDNVSAALGITLDYSKGQGDARPQSEGRIAGEEEDAADEGDRD